MKSLAAVLALFAGLSVAQSSGASDTFNTVIVEVRVGIGNPSVGVIQIGVDPANRPACATYSTGNNFFGRWFAVDLSTDGGREALKLALAAQLAGKKVRLTGTGTCTVNTNKENLSSLYVQN